VRLLVFFNVEFVVEVYEIVVQVIVEIVVIVVEIVIVQVVVVELVVIKLIELVVIVVELVLEIFIPGWPIARYLLRQPSSSLPIPVVVQEALLGLQHGRHYRDLLVG